MSGEQQEEKDPVLIAIEEMNAHVTQAVMACYQAHREAQARYTEALRDATQRYIDTFQQSPLGHTPNADAGDAQSDAASASAG